MKLVNYFSCFCCISELIYFVNSSILKKIPSVHLVHKLSLWGKTPVMWETIWARNPGQVIRQGQETQTCWYTGQSPLFLLKILSKTQAKYQVKTNKTNKYHKKPTEIFRECEKIRDVPAWLLSYSFWIYIVRAFWAIWYE